jgi:ribonuclease HI
VDGRHHIYTDGSMKGGTAACSYVVGTAGRGARYSENLGQGTSVYRAELTAIRLAVESPHCLTDGWIWCDNQAAVRAIGGRPSSDPDVSIIQRTAVERGARIAWIPGHSGITGNETADALAQETAEATPDAVAPYLEPSTLKRRNHALTLHRWEETWRTTRNGADLKRVDTTCLGGTITLYAPLDRRTASLVAQVRTGHLATNDYLHRRRVPGVDAACATCERREDRSHLLRCPRLASAMRALECELVRIWCHVGPYGRECPA